MRRVEVTEMGRPEVLKIQTVGDLSAGRGEVVVALEAAGVNFIDVYQRKGIYKAPTPYTPGFEGVGRITAVGPEAGLLAVGDRVCWVNVFGSYAEQVVVRAEKAIPVMESFRVEEGLLFQALTAQYLISEYRTIKPSDVVLVHAAAGGVGQVLVQWLAHIGARVIATVSTAAKGETARALGAETVIDYSQGGFLDEVMEATGGRGVDLVYDAVGKTTLEDSVKALAARGTVVTYGAASGPAPAINPAMLVEKAKRLAGGSIFGYIEDPVELQRRSAEVVAGLREGWLKLVGAKGYPLAEAARAHADLEGRVSEGKLMLFP